MSDHANEGVDTGQTASEIAIVLGQHKDRLDVVPRLVHFQTDILHQTANTLNGIVARYSTINVVTYLFTECKMTNSSALTSKSNCISNIESNINNNICMDSTDILDFSSLPLTAYHTKRRTVQILEHIEAAAVVRSRCQSFHQILHPLVEYRIVLVHHLEVHGRIQASPVVTPLVAATGEQAGPTDDVIDDRGHLAAVGRLGGIHHELHVPRLRQEDDELLEHPEAHRAAVPTPHFPDGLVDFYTLCVRV